jgi:tetratricopeptide (TPR) repeat protein
MTWTARALLLSILFLSSLFISPLLADEGHHHSMTAEELGTVHFQTSCSPKVEAEFNRGVALLHSFWYEEAEKTFRKVAREDRKCAMSNWGIAMSQYHQLWDYPDAKGLAENAALLTKAEAMKATSREQEYIHALHVYFASLKPGKAPQGKPEYDHAARATAYSEAMEQVALHHADDREALVFYALSLLASQPPHDTTFVQRKKAAAILEKVFAEDAKHPGVAHYLIHSYDKPQLAEYGLKAARSYAKIAPAAPHALHMPSHIFARLGLWQEDIDSNLASIAATRKTAAMHMGDASHQFHAMDYLVYAYLQSGREGEVARVIQELDGIKSLDEDEWAYSMAEFNGLYDLELHRWEDAAKMQPVAGDHRSPNAMIHFTRALGAARNGRADAARADVQEIEKIRLSLVSDEKQEAADGVEQLGKVAGAWLALAEDKGDDGVKTLRAVSDEEDAEGSEQAGIPAREMLADMLLQMNRPEEALAEYEHSLKSNPGRFDGLAGAAQAAEKLGKQQQAESFHGQLLKSCAGSNSDRPELRHARLALASK